MNVGLYQAAAALDANLRCQEVMADNMASSSVAGFKREELATRSIPGGSLPLSGAPHLPFSAYFTLPKVETYINFEQGETRYTGSPTDVALSGPGFLEVQMPNDVKAYTRKGELRISPQGVLVTKDGHQVLGAGGSTIQVDRTNPSPVSISTSGEASQGNDIIGKLAATEFNDLSLLRSIGGGYFLANDPNLKASPSPTTSFQQKYVEASNTSVMHEMAKLIVSMRQYEANQRVIQHEDQRMDRTIRELAGPN